MLALGLVCIKLWDFNGLAGYSVMECCLTILISIIYKIYVLQQLFNLSKTSLLDGVIESLPEFLP